MERAALSAMTASDGAVALRSLPRRFQDCFLPAELSGAPGAANPAAQAPGHRSPLELVGTAAAAMGTLTRALERVLGIDNPELGEFLDRSRHSATPSAGVVSALDQLSAAANTLADRIAQVPLRDWGRPATEVGQQIEALDVVREAVAVGRTSLDALPAALVALRRLG